MSENPGELANTVTRRKRLLSIARTMDVFGQKSHWSAEDIHALRLCCKRLRSWVRLQPKRKNPVWTQFDTDIRALARGVGAARDQRVLQNTLQWLGDTATTSEQRAACSAVADCLPPSSTEAIAIPAELRAQASQLAATALLLPVAAEQALLGSLDKNYRRARRFSQQALRRGTDAGTLHRFRRRVKYLQYQLALLSRHRHPLHKAFNTLGDTLGSINDLHVLHQRLESSSVPAPQREQVVQLLKQQKKLLRKTLRPLCKLAFAEPRPQLF